MIEKIIKESKNWSKADPATEEDIHKLISESKIKFEDDYISFLKISNGGEGELPLNPYWFQIWPAEEIIENNKNYEVDINAPSFIAFGSNGGGEMLVFKILDGKTNGIYCIPFIPMDENDAEFISKDFISLVNLFGKAEE